MIMRKELLEQLRGGLVVSCQAFDYEPFYGAEMMAKMAVSAKLGGAAAIRASWPENIRAIKKEVDLPIFGINKIMPEVYDKFRDVIITPTLTSARGCRGGRRGYRGCRLHAAPGAHAGNDPDAAAGI